MASTAAAVTFPLTTDDASQVTERQFGPFVAADLASLTLPLFTTTEPIRIESILARNTTAGTGTIRFWYAPSGTALGSGTALTAVEDMSGLTANNLFGFTLTNNTTIIPAGYTVGVVGASVATMSGLNLIINTRRGNFVASDSGELFHGRYTSAKL